MNMKQPSTIPYVLVEAEEFFRLQALDQAAAGMAGVDITGLTISIGWKDPDISGMDVHDSVRAVARLAKRL
jgi:hypothetical protein